MADYNFVIETGTIIPDTDAVQSEVESEYKQIFGSDFDTDPTTPQGELITAEVTSRQSVLRNNALVANQINPNLAYGPFLDGIWSFLDGQRTQGSPSTVVCTLSGVNATFISSGSLVQDINGIQWELLSSVTIGISGTIDGNFQATIDGATQAQPADINQVVTSILGWDTVTNAAAATPGNSTQSDISVRVERRETVGAQGNASSQAVIAAVTIVEGVNSLIYRSNIENTPEVIDGVNLVPHSIWVCVEGGTDTDIATAIAESKGDGSNYNGSVSVPYTDIFSGQVYNVLFERPTVIDMLIRVTIEAVSGVDVTDQIVQAVLDYANGKTPSGKGFVVGNDVSPFEISAAVSNAVRPLFINKVEVAPVSTGIFQTETFPINIDEIAQTENSSISVITL